MNQISCDSEALEAAKYRVAHITMSDEANGQSETIFCASNSQALFGELSAWLKSMSKLLFDDLCEWLDPTEMAWFEEEDNVEEMTWLDVEKRLHALLDARAAELRDAQPDATILGTWSDLLEDVSECGPYDSESYIHILFEGSLVEFMPWLTEHESENLRDLLNKTCRGWHWETGPSQSQILSARLTPRLLWLGKWQVARQVLFLSDRRSDNGLKLVRALIEEYCKNHEF